MKLVTANRVTNGAPVYRTKAGGWTEAIHDAALFEDQAAKDVLADATLEETLVVGPYLMSVDDAGEPVRREALRETIRKFGPSVHPEMARPQQTRREP